MNTIGKTLVILNFVFAIVVGAFLAFDFSTRTQWKKAYDELKREAEVLNASKQAIDPLTANITAQLTKYKQEAEQAKSTLKDTEDAAKAQEATLQVVIEDYKNKLKDADTTLQTSLAENKRMTSEVALLNKTVTEREKAVIALEGDVKKYRQEAIKYEGEKASGELRIEQLQKIIDEKLALIAEMSTRGNGTTVAKVNPLNAVNPPRAKVEGIVAKVQGELVELSVGSDQGLTKDNTLEVYRTSPRAVYLGMVRIIDTYPHRSVARVVRGSGSRAPLQEGDHVSSQINP